MKLHNFSVCMISTGMIATALLAAPQETVSRENESSGRDHKRWMAIKLNAAQQSLEHLTSGNLDELAKSARRLQMMNVLEKWMHDSKITAKSEYRGQLNKFEFATKELIRHAEDDDVAGSLKAYIAVTESCVNCHSLIRDPKPSADML